MPLRSQDSQGGKAVGSPQLINGVDKDKKESNGRTPLHQAAAEGSVSAIKALLVAGESMDLSFGRGRMAECSLHIAAYHGEVGVMRVLLENGVDVDNATASGYTALHVASERNFVDAVELLLGDAGAQVNPKNSEGLTPLHAALAERATGAIVALLRHGADVGALDNDGWPPLHLAAQGGYASAIDALCEAGADVNLRVENAIDFGPPDELAALDMAADQGHVNALGALIRHGADVIPSNPNGHTALYWAARGNNVEVINELVAAGADVDGSSPEYIPLHAAAIANSSEAICALARHGADLCAKDEENQTALMCAASDRHCAGSIDALVAAGVDPNLAYDGWSPLMMAACQSQVECVNRLIQFGAAVDWADDEEGETALTVAVDNFPGDSEVIDALIAAGADVNSRKGEWTPLQMACHRETGLLTIPILLRHGADVNMPGNEGSSPLHWAVRRRCGESVFRERVPVEAVDLLLRAGADETAVDEDGLTPAEQLLLEIGLGSFEGADRVLDLLKRAPADRAWRRRGLLLLCHAYRRKALQEPRGGRSKILRTGRGGIEPDGDPVERDAAREDAGTREFSSVMAWLFGVEEEGIFRQVVCFL